MEEKSYLEVIYSVSKQFKRLLQENKFEVELKQWVMSNRTQF